MVSAEFVSTLEMHFDDMDEAFAFYETYAMLAGFNVRKNRKKNNGRAQDFECSFAGKPIDSRGADRLIAKTSKKRDCKAMVKAKSAVDGGRVYFTKIVLEHNHVLTRSPTMTKHMRSHKLREAGICEMIDSMHRAKISHVNVMGGASNLTITEVDVRNRYFGSS